MESELKLSLQMIMWQQSNFCSQLCERVKYRCQCVELAGRVGYAQPFAERAARENREHLTLSVLSSENGF